MADLFKQTGEFVPDSLIASNVFPIMTKGILLGRGQGHLKRGALLGKASDGLFYQTGASISDEIVGAFGILADDCNTEVEAGSDLVAACYITGCFNKDALILAEGASIDSYEDDLKKIGIYLNTVQQYD